MMSCLVIPIVAGEPGEAKQPSGRRIKCFLIRSPGGSTFQVRPQQREEVYPTDSFDFLQPVTCRRTPESLHSCGSGPHSFVISDSEEQLDRVVYEKFEFLLSSR